MVACLYWHLQACFDYIFCPFDPPDCRPSRSIRPLLQALPSFRQDPRLCYDSCHIPRPYAHSRPLRVFSSGGLDHPHLISCRVRILIDFLPRWTVAQHLASTANRRRDIGVLLSHKPTKIFTTSSAYPLTFFSTTQRTYHHCVQCWTHAGRNHLAYTTQPGIHSICRGLESS